MSARIRESGLFKVSAGSTVTVTTGTATQDGGTLEVAAGGTLSCPSGNVTASENGVVKGSGTIKAISLRDRGSQLQTFRYDPHAPYFAGNDACIHGIRPGTSIRIHPHGRPLGCLRQP